MTVIEASFVTYRMLVDGTLRVQLDIEPRHRDDAAKLFGAPGTPMALAALRTAQAAPEPKAEPEAPPEKPKGGMWSQWCAIRCSEVEFQRWLAKTFPKQWERWFDKSARSVAPKIDPALVAANVVREVCGLESRAELDHDEAAKARFDERIRAPWQKHYQAVHA